MAGGETAEGVLNDFFSFDLRAPAFQQHAPMSVGRSSHALVGLAQEVFALGGISVAGEQDSLNSVDIFDIRMGAWRPGQAMPHSRSPTSHPRISFAALALSETRLLCVGGFDGVDFPGLDRTTVVYDASAASWSYGMICPTARRTPIVF